MAVNKPRNRILIFRLTQEEYAALQSASSGARSLSEFARAKLLSSLNAPPLDEQLTDLKTAVTRIAEILESGTGPERPSLGPESRAGATGSGAAATGSVVPLKFLERT